MKRVRTEEILDSHDCPAHEAAASLRDIGRINRWFGGVTTTRKLIERAAAVSGMRYFSVLEVGAGFGEVPRLAARQLARRGITLEITYLDCMYSHLVEGSRAVVANGLAIPFRDNAFDLVNCSLFAHHLEPDELAAFAREAMRVSRCALLINDLVRHPVHLALVYAGFPLMRSYVSRVDGVASVRRSYLPEEMREILSNDDGGRVEISRNYLYRMGVIVWKTAGQNGNAPAA